MRNNRRRVEGILTETFAVWLIKALFHALKDRLDPIRILIFKSKSSLHVAYHHIVIIYRLRTQLIYILALFGLSRLSSLICYWYFVIISKLGLITFLLTDPCLVKKELLNRFQPLRYFSPVLFRQLINQTDSLLKIGSY